ncbi:uncharacterized protein MKK02DRAFT_40031 [Dioszegia hungarica]|uniref:PWWP domain-containing protein n=1 Tax=Dioszegia hungarica TaxID=4972 RepID=A0AA38HGJ0_9TREE|nr:uncharacterized protein MKK02DRAFT_40031 [Dioszegia hungarica]KAI9639708.1 hypothetical protein MKK02DRAFT_40031 [Dioszegia hungarica]
MPKRKTSPCRSSSKGSITLSSLDAALDMLATDTFTRLDSLIAKFENAAGIQVAPGQAKVRWEEAVKRYWVMRSMEVLSCSGYADKGKGKAKEGAGAEEGDAAMEDGEEAKDETGRSIPKPHLGPVAMYGLCADEEQQWRRWSPKPGDVVLVDLPDNGVWPGKVIDKKVFYQGRTMPKGYHYFPVRIYDEGIEPCVTVKSRLLPFHLRPAPPLLASISLQSAYHHAASPSGFDTLAHTREQNAAHCRSHPGVGGDPADIKREKERWNEQVNWVMNERRAEKMRILAEEREKRLASITVVKVEPEDERGCHDDSSAWDDHDRGGGGGGGGGGKKKRRTSIPLPDISKKGRSGSPLPNNTIFGPMSTVPSPFPATSIGSTPRRTSSPALGGAIRPGFGIATPIRPLSPRRAEKRRSVYGGMGEYSPGRTRGGTWTPPRILPSGDETAPGAFGGGGGGGTGGLGAEGMRDGSSPVPSGKFDFVSPLGPVNGGRLNGGNSTVASSLTMTTMGERGLQRSGSLSAIGAGPGVGELESVKEEEGEAEDGWTLVSAKKRGKGRAGSAPCEKVKGGQGEEGAGAAAGSQGAMEEDMDL